MIMTYKDVAENLVTLYANYVEVCTDNGEDYEDFSEEIVVAIEALLNQSNRDISKEYFTKLNSVAPKPPEEVIEELFKW